MADLLPRKFTVQQLEAVASHEKSRACNVCQQQISSVMDLVQAINIIKEWYQRWPHRSLRLDFNLCLKEVKKTIPEASAATSSLMGGKKTRKGRKTATSSQLSYLPELLAAKEGSGNYIPKIADKWSCTNRHCSNFPKTCWRNSTPTASDNVLHHYPVSSEILVRWNRELLKGKSTVDQPLQNIVVQLANWKERKKKTVELEQPPKETERNNTVDNLLKILLVKELRSQPQSGINLGQQQYMSDQARGSSPITSQTDPVELLGLFLNGSRINQDLTVSSSGTFSVI